MTEKELIEMPLHSSILVGSDCSAFRVLRGLIYESRNYACFVPETERFQISGSPEVINSYHLFEKERIKLNCKPSSKYCTYPECRCSTSEDKNHSVQYCIGGNGIGGDL